LANYVESSIGAPNERAEITVTPEGRVTVIIGTQASGQGHETSFAQVMADLLGVPVERIDIVAGDTDVFTVSGGSPCGGWMRHAATVFAKATTAPIARGNGIAAALLDTPADAVTFTDGRFGSPSSTRTFDFLELAHEAALHDLGPLAAAADNEMHDPVF